MSPTGTALLLNADYRPLSRFPLSTITWQQAVKLHHEGVLDIVAEYPDRFIRSPSVTIKMPSVVALRRYVPTPKIIPFTRNNLFLRDGFRCQYCGDKFSSRDLSFDHVVPRCDGGKTSWENIVAACVPCNTAKDVKRLVPRTVPVKPTYGMLLRAADDFPPGYLHATWESYLYWNVELET